MLHRLAYGVVEVEDYVKSKGYMKWSKLQTIQVAVTPGQMAVSRRRFTLPCSVGALACETYILRYVQEASVASLGLPYAARTCIADGGLGDVHAARPYMALTICGSHAFDHIADADRPSTTASCRFPEVLTLCNSYQLESIK